MPDSFLERIESSVVCNLSNRAIAYYRENSWKWASYSEVDCFARELKKHINQLSREEWTTYIVVYFKQTWTFPILILG